MIAFARPGASDTYPVMGASAARPALEDAGLNHGRVQQAHAGFVHGDSAAGQRPLCDVGMSRATRWPCSARK